MKGFTHMKQNITAENQSGTRNDAAYFIAGALACPDLPYPIRRGILEGFCQVDTHDELYQNAAFVREIFTQHTKAQEGRMD
jgi:hypothetical protein